MAEQAGGTIPAASQERKKRKRAERQQANLIRLQKQKEQARLAEEEDVLARQRLLATSPRSGRRALINPSSGLRQTLG